MAMLRTSLGQLLVNAALPEDLRDYDRQLDKAGLTTLLREVALKHPDRYADVSKRLADVGRVAATRTGGNSFGAAALSKSQAGRKYQLKIRQRLKQILDDDTLDDAARERLVVAAAGADQQQQTDEVLAESLAEGNPLAMQVLSGARGNKMNLNRLRGSDRLYADHRGQVQPLPVLSSYSEGLKPVEYWAASYGARSGVVATKFATADAGFLGKQLNQVSHRLVVTDDDDPRTDLPVRGLPVSADDPHNEGALLAQDVGGFKRNTVLTPKILSSLHRGGHAHILVRSPLVGGSPEGGVYARDVGVHEYGTLPARGEQAGLVAAQALAEPVSQGTLESKHGGGVAGQQRAVSGFDAIDQQIQIPSTFKGGAAHSQVDGTVGRVDPTPAGGHHVWVGDERHYVGAGYGLKVRPGDVVEAGDVLSDGFVNPSEAVRHKGIGEGRRQFVTSFMDALRGAGMRPHRRNVELLARGLINHVRLTEPWGDHLPDEVLPYSTVEHLWEPRDGHEVVHPARALGKHLEKPVLHYTVGTKVRPSVFKELKQFGVKEIAVHQDPPPFEPEMIRGMYSLQHDPDWMTRMYGSGLKKSLLDAVHHGAVSDEGGTSFVPGLARAVDFGRGGLVRAPEERVPLPPEGVPVKEEDVAKRGKRPAALDVKPPPKTPTFFGGLGSLFKTSIDRVTQLREARELLAKVADDVKAPTVDRQPAPVGGKPGAPAPGPPGDTWEPPAAWSTRQERDTFATNNKAQTATPPPASPQPGGTTNAATPGQVHPARQQFGQQQPTTPYGRNPYAQATGGYQPGFGVLPAGTDPEQIAEFVRGGGDPDQPGTGYGGFAGDVTRFGSVLDRNAISALTGQSPYVRGDYGHPAVDRPPHAGPTEVPGMRLTPRQGYGGGPGGGPGGAGQEDDVYGQLGSGGGGGGEEGKPWSWNGVLNEGGRIGAYGLADLGLRVGASKALQRAGPAVAGRMTAPGIAATTNVAATKALTGANQAVTAAAKELAAAKGAVTNAATPAELAVARTTLTQVEQKGALAAAEKALAQAEQKFALNAAERLAPAGLEGGGAWAAKHLGMLYAAPINAAAEGVQLTVGYPDVNENGEWYRHPARQWRGPEYREWTTPTDKVMGADDPTGGFLSSGGAALNAWSNPLEGGHELLENSALTGYDAVNGLGWLTGVRGGPPPEAVSPTGKAVQSLATTRGLAEQGATQLAKDENTPTGRTGQRVPYTNFRADTRTDAAQGHGNEQISLSLGDDNGTHVPLLPSYQAVDTAQQNLTELQNIRGQARPLGDYMRNEEVARGEDLAKTVARLEPVRERWVAAGKPPNWTDPQTGEWMHAGRSSDIDNWKKQLQMTPAQRLETHQPGDYWFWKGMAGFHR